MMKLKRFFLTALLPILLPLLASAQQAEQMLGLDGSQQVKSDRQIQNVLALSFNPGFITSKVDTGSGETSWQGGLGFAADYRCVFRSGYGFGLSYSHSQTNYEERYFSIPVKLDYVGPSFVMAGPIGGLWNARLSCGLGYAHYSNNYESDNGMGYQFVGGVEYHPSKVFAIGIDLTEELYVFPKNEKHSKYETNGFSRLGINAGLRIYL